MLKYLYYLVYKQLRLTNECTTRLIALISLLPKPYALFYMLRQAIIAPASQTPR